MATSAKRTFNYQQEIALLNARYESTIKDLRKRNGDLMDALIESAPNRIGDQGEILPLERVEAKAAQAGTGMRTSAVPCESCGNVWTEPSRRGRMGKKCPDCKGQ